MALMLPSGQAPASVGMLGQPEVGGQMLTAQSTSYPISLPGQQHHSIVCNKDAPEQLVSAV